MFRLLLLIAVAFSGCVANNSPQDGSDEFQAQVEAYNRQTEQQGKILAQQEAEMDRMTKQSDRIDKLLTKQEEHAKRWDAILDAEEKRVGIKP